MLTAVALDDEIPALEIVEAFAARSQKIHLKATFSKTGEALRFLEKNYVDLIFLDINMPALSGIDFAKKIDKNIIVIFTTSYSEYAVEGFNLNAADYLLKPFSYQRFSQSLDKAQTLYQARLADPEVPLHFKINYGIVQVLPSEMLFIEGLNNYLKIHLYKKKSLVVRLTMKEIMEQLPSDNFLRVHRSFIIAVSKVEFVRNKTIHIGAHEIPLGGKYADDFSKIFK